MVTMKPGAWWLGGSLAVAVAAVGGCNAVLGIGAASLEDDGGGPNPQRSPTCSYYCSTIIKNCTGPYAEFVGSGDAQSLCTTMCQVYDSNNQISASNDNTLGCRIYYAEQAASDPNTNCRIAGPLGGGVCGTSPCALFCSLDVQYCNSMTIDTPAYANVDDCATACASYPYMLVGPDLLDSTNTLNCRFWHLENAYGSTQAGMFHCPHTVQASALCVDPPDQ
jgi:hypothetical protein